LPYSSSSSSAEAAAAAVATGEPRYNARTCRAAATPGE